MNLIAWFFLWSICNIDVSALLMQEHEQALIDAISKIADISDGESGIF